MPRPPQLTGGSRKGKPNKSTAELKDMIRGALDDAGGREYLAKQAKENPVAFMNLIAKILPRDINASIDVTQRITKIELVALESTVDKPASTSVLIEHESSALNS